MRDESIRTQTDALPALDTAPPSGSNSPWVASLALAIAIGLSLPTLSTSQSASACTGTTTCNYDWDCTDPTCICNTTNHKCFKR